MRYVYVPDDERAPSASVVGGKALGLFRLQRAGCAVPRWFAVTSEAWVAAAREKENRGAAGAHSDGASELLPLPECVEEMSEAIRSLGLSDARLAVRSSARAEDSGEVSFAGQFATVLHVPPGELASAVGRVWASADTVHCREYASQHGVPIEELVPAVVVQEMLAPDISGVLFTADPVSGSRDVSVIAALYGLGEGIVSGSCTPDTYTIDKDGGVVKRGIAHKQFQIVWDAAAGVCQRAPVADHLRDAQVCPDEVLARLAELGGKIAGSFGSPQDIEWCLEGDRIHVLQSRPITTLHASVLSDAHQEEPRVWDNANIVESYPGITLPLTFSFIDEVYTGVYGRMCLAFGVSESYLQQHRSRLRMLGYYRGRVYYNLLNWYWFLTLLPGGRHHRRYFNEMLGIGGGIDAKQLPPARRAEWLRSAAMVSRLLVRFVVLPLQVRRFLKRVRAVRGRADAVDLDTVSLIGLVDHYRQLEHLLLRHWITPQFNDFYCQTATGLLKGAISRWLGGQHVTGMHQLLTVKQPVESERAINSLRELAAAIRARPELVEACQASPPPELLRELREDGSIRERFDEHLRRFGDRWHGELKLETLTPAEDPEVLVEVLASHVLAPPERTAGGGDRDFRAALAELPAAKRWVIGVLAWLSRGLIANRENTRFERTRVFGLVRGIFRTLGRRLAERGHLASADDIFYLTKGEVFDLVEGTAIDDGPAATVRHRRQVAEGWRKQTAPGRFRSDGLLIEHRGPAEPGGEPAAAGSLTLSGTGASAGLVRARARVIRAPGDLGDARGCVIAAESTDPGWSFIFPLVSGVLVERGSLLSHAAIVAREMQIPAIVGIEGLMRRLPDGALVEIDGSAGTVTVLRDQQEDAAT